MNTNTETVVCSTIRANNAQNPNSSIDKSIALSIFPNAQVVYVKGRPHIFNNGIDLSIQHSMKPPKNLKQAWVHAAKTAQYAESVQQLNNCFMNEGLAFKESEFGLDPVHFQINSKVS